MSDVEKYDRAAHFTDDGKSSKITHLPQCVGCVHNLGLLNCAALGKKTEEILQNAEICPERTPE